MSERVILSEKLEDNKAAAEWGVKQAELMRKSEEITKIVVAEYTPVILERMARKNGEKGTDKHDLS
jgi:hypothetical protein